MKKLDEMIDALIEQEMTFIKDNDDIYEYVRYILRFGHKGINEYSNDEIKETFLNM